MLCSTSTLWTSHKMPVATGQGSTLRNTRLETKEYTNGRPIAGCKDAAVETGDQGMAVACPG